MAVIMAFALTMTTTAITAFAAYTPVTGGTTTFDKNLVVDADATVPNIRFAFTIEPGTAVDGTATTYQILAGVGTPTIGDVTFSSTSPVTENATPSGADTTKKYATEQATVDFTSVNFTAPGVYATL